ncbi:polysaccharide polymerase [Aeromonas simiae]|uniref:polysaccharide polymerase n=1 Tax=Aeromonas simiae TaxID=218936 RepID=UPI001869297E|nr:polysaccharide polymerase [Aeromonas simiae]
MSTLLWSRPLPAALQAQTSPSERAVLALLLASVLYQSLLCMVNTLLFAINPTLVALVEALIYGGVLLLVYRRLPLGLALLALLALVNLLSLTVLRGLLDAKSVRDILIIVLFFWLGLRHGSAALVDKVLLLVVGVALLLGLFEWLALEWYIRVFHTFSYFVNQSGIGRDGGAIFSGQALTLNGFRPDGIGRTILPWLFGPHRISSIFLEPVSLGNFSVIVLIWALCREGERRVSLLLAAGAAMLIALSDSRFGLAMSAMLIALRLLLPLRATALLALAPWAMMAAVYIYSNCFFEGAYSDSFVGRLTYTGKVLGTLEVGDMLGLQSPLGNYGDMGYAYVLTRFGLPFLLLGWGLLWLIPLHSAPALRVRALISLYIAMILSISGTSLFALKSAGLLWFLVGSLCAEGGARQEALSHAGVQRHDH